MKKKYSFPCKSFMLAAILFCSLINIRSYGQCCTVDSLIINTGYDPLSGAAVPPQCNTCSTPVPDPKWTVCSITPDFYTQIIISGLIPVTSGPADVIQPDFTWISQPPAKPGGWISCFNGTSFNGGDADDSMQLCRQFNLCTPAVVAFHMRIADDNYATNVTVDGNYVYAQPVPGVYYYYTYFDSTVPVYTMLLGAGTHTLSVTVNEDEGGSGNAAGLDLTGTIYSYDPSTLAPVNALVNEGVSVIAGISGILSICQGATTTLSDATPGGTWSSSNAGIATVGPISSVVTGVTAGTATITYTTFCGSAVTTVTINPGPLPITGDSLICLTSVGGATVLYDATTSGLWTNNNTTVATIDPISGYVTGLSVGTSEITYTAHCGYVTTIVTVSTTPDIIAGTSSVCVGATITLQGSVSGGVWTSSNTSVATVAALDPVYGVVTGVAAGTSIITYATLCGYATDTVTVNPPPLPITGDSLICLISTGGSTVLFDATTGGTWSSSNTTVANIDPTSGYVTGLSVGTSIITYTALCGYVTTIVTVSTTPDIIAGTSSVCVGATLTLQGSVSGGVWTSSNTSVATVAALDPVYGVVTGVAAGTSIITYATLCGYATETVTVNPTPLPIVGILTLCLSSTMSTNTLTDGVPGGTWTSSNTTVAIIGSSSGVVHALSAGTSVITYATQCGSVVATVTVNPVPASISGTFIVCQGSTTALGDVVGGGSWTSSNTAIATVGSLNGIVLGVSPGTSVITYITVCGAVSAIVTVIPTPVASCVCSYVGTGNTFSELGSSGIITSGTYSGNYYINHSVIVQPGTTFFNNCVIAIANGASITVGSKTKLVLNSSHLFSCHSDMWRGIILSTALYSDSTIIGSGATGQLEITGTDIQSMIEDAMVAVDIPTPLAMAGYSAGSGATTLYTLYSHGGTLNQNMTGVRISNYSASFPVTSVTDVNPSYPFIMDNTVFTCRDFSGYSTGTASWPFVWPSTIALPGALMLSVTPAPYEPPYYINSGYLPVVCNNGLLSQYGIDLEDVGTESGAVGAEHYSAVALGSGPGTGNHPDLFDNMNYGVYAHNSNFLSRNGLFMNMYPVPNGGDGIYAVNDNFGKYQLYVYGSASGSYTNEFWNSVNCVQANEYYNVMGTRAIMSSKHKSTNLSDPQGIYGYKISSSNYYELQTNYNTIYNITNGISITTNTPAVGGVQFIGQTTSDNNKISNVDPISGPVLHDEYVNQAITMQNLTSPVSTGILPGSEQNVDSNTISGVYNGVLINNYNSSATGSLTQITTTVLNTVGVVHNPFFITTNPNQSGINHTNTVNDYVYDNHVFGPGYTIPTPPSFSGNTYFSTPVIEGIHIKNYGSTLSVDCNSVSDLNTGFYFEGHASALAWVGNTMDSDAYGFVLNGVLGTISGGSSSGTYADNNEWLPSGFWTAPKWQTYTLGTTNAALSTLYVSSSPSTQEPIVNAGEGSSVPYRWTPLYGIAITTSPAMPCKIPPASGVPEAMRPNIAAEVDPVTINTAGSLSVIPNPNKGIFTLKGTIPEMGTATEATIEILDMAGRILYSTPTSIQDGDIETQISLTSNIANGIYLIKLRNEQASKVLRFTLDR